MLVANSDVPDHVPPYSRAAELSLVEDSTAGVTVPVNVAHNVRLAQGLESVVCSGAKWHGKDMLRMATYRPLRR